MHPSGSGTVKLQEKAPSAADSEGEKRNASMKRDVVSNMIRFIVIFLQNKTPYA
jgi:hypothetical protein